VSDSAVSQYLLEFSHAIVGDLIASATKHVYLRKWFQGVPTSISDVSLSDSK
jgi:hypothetical protein